MPIANHKLFKEIQLWTIVKTLFLDAETVCKFSENHKMVEISKFFIIILEHTIHMTN
jgi:hypothetical protein